MTGRQPDPEELHRTAWTILGTMVAGIAVFATIAGVLREGADPGLPGVPWLGIWAIAGPPLVVLATVLQRRLLARGATATEPHREPPPSGGAAPPALTAHVVAWALIEGPAMLGCVAYLMGADPLVLIASLVTAAVGFALTAPRREAFGPR
jgi:hypothetical protein